MQLRRSLLPLATLCAILALCLCLLPSAQAETVPIGPDHALVPFCPHCATAVSLNAGSALYDLSAIAGICTRRELRQSPAMSIPYVSAASIAATAASGCRSSGMDSKAQRNRSRSRT